MARLLGGDVAASPLPLDPTAARFRLHQAVSGFLGRVGAGRPLVVVLDDMHWADVSSLELIRFVAADQSATPFLLVLTYRTVDGGDTGLLDEVLASLARLPTLERIALDGLSEAEVGRFMAQTIGLRPRRSAIVSVHARTDGNPFFVAELPGSSTARACCRMSAATAKTPSRSPCATSSAGAWPGFRRRPATRSSSAPCSAVTSS